MTNTPHEAYLQRQLDGYKKKNKELEKENEKLREKVNAYFSYIAQMGAVLFFALVFAITVMVVTFNG